MASFSTPDRVETRSSAKTPSSALKDVIQGRNTFQMPFKSVIFPNGEILKGKNPKTIQIQCPRLDDGVLVELVVDAWTMKCAKMVNKRERSKAFGNDSFIIDRRAKDERGILFDSPRLSFVKEIDSILASKGLEIDDRDGSERIYYGRTKPIIEASIRKTTARYTPLAPIAYEDNWRIKNVDLGHFTIYVEPRGEPPSPPEGYRDSEPDVADEEYESDEDDDNDGSRSSEDPSSSGRGSGGGDERARLSFSIAEWKRKMREWEEAPRVISKMAYDVLVVARGIRLDGDETEEDNGQRGSKRTLGGTEKGTAKDVAAKKGIKERITNIDVALGYPAQMDVDSGRYVIEVVGDVERFDVKVTDPDTFRVGTLRRAILVKCLNHSQYRGKFGHCSSLFLKKGKAINILNKTASMWKYINDAAKAKDTSVTLNISVGIVNVDAGDEAIVKESELGDAAAAAQFSQQVALPENREKAAPAARESAESAAERSRESKSDGSRSRDFTLKLYSTDHPDNDYYHAFTQGIFGAVKEHFEQERFGRSSQRAWNVWDLEDSFPDANHMPNWRESYVMEFTKGVMPEREKFPPNPPGSMNLPKGPKGPGGTASGAGGPFNMTGFNPLAQAISPGQGSAMLAQAQAMATAVRTGEAGASVTKKQRMVIFAREYQGIRSQVFFLVPSEPVFCTPSGGCYLDLLLEGGITVPVSRMDCNKKTVGAILATEGVKVPVTMMVMDLPASKKVKGPLKSVLDDIGG